MNYSRQNQHKHQTQQLKSTTQQQPVSKHYHSLHPIEELQEQVGNHALGRLIESQSLPSRSHHSIAHSSLIQAKFLFQGLSHELSSGSTIQGKLEEETAQINTSVPSRNDFHQATANLDSGSTLPPNVQSKMERSFNTSFSNVRIHQGPQAKAIGALAYTQGNDIHFQPGQYNPQSLSGQELLGHELTHVVQQQSGLVSTSPQQDKLSINTDSTLEAEADRMGARSARGQVAEVSGAGSGIQRQVIQRQTGTYGVERRIGTSYEDEYKRKQAGTGYVTTQEGSQKRSTKAEAAARRIMEASDTEIKQAVEALAEAGVFGEVARKAAVKRGAFSASAEGSVSGSATAGVSAKASASVKDIMEGLTVMAEVSAGARIEGNLEGRLAATAGPFAAELSAKLKLSGSVLGQAKGTFDIGLAKGMIAEFSASASAKVEASGEVKASIGAYDMTIDLTAEGKAMAGAEASVEGRIAITLDEVTVSGKAEAFAGVKAKGSVGTSLTYKGKVLVKLSAEAEASAGVGGSIKGEFSYKNGKLILGGKLSSTLGIGGGLDATVEADPKEILKVTGYAIKDAVKDKIVNKTKKLDRNSSLEERQPMPAEEKDEIAAQLYDAVIYDFEAYGRKKNKHGKHGIKQEEVQKILDDEILRKETLNKYVLFQEADEILEKAAYDAFGDQLEMILIQAGNIRAFQAGTKERTYNTLNTLASASPQYPQYYVTRF